MGVEKREPNIALNPIPLNPTSLVFWVVVKPISPKAQKTP